MTKYGPSFDRPEELAELVFGPATKAIADKIWHELFDICPHIPKPKCPNPCQECMKMFTSEFESVSREPDSES